MVRSILYNVFQKNRRGGNTLQSYHEVSIDTKTNDNTKETKNYRPKSLMNINTKISPKYKNKK